MSGYRTIHRERILAEDTAIWSVQMILSSGGSCWRIFCASSDGYLRVYAVTEKKQQRRPGGGGGGPQSAAAATAAKDNDDALDASALQIQCTHTLLGSTQPPQPTASSSAADQTLATTTSLLGCTQVSIVRNYMGQDDTAGDLIVASLDLGGTVRLWSFDQSFFGEEDTTPTTRSTDDDNNNGEYKQPPPKKVVRCKSEFVINQATGTTLALASPRIMTTTTTTTTNQRKSKDNNSAAVVAIVMAVGCLDGTIALISTGIMVAGGGGAAKEDNNGDDVVDAAGKVVETIGSPGGSALALCLCWHPIANSEMLAAGRQDGAVDLLVLCGNNNNNNNNNNDKGGKNGGPHKKKNHRLLHHAGHPVRSVVYTADGHLLLTGADNGNICIYDLQRPAPVLVHHLPGAHTSWILNIQCCADARRFITLGRDAAIRVWNVGQTSQSLHTYRLDDTVAWTMHHAPNSARMVAGSDDGWLFVYSIES